MQKEVLARALFLGCTVWVGFMIQKHAGMAVFSIFAHIAWLTAWWPSCRSLKRWEKNSYQMIHKDLGVLYEILECQLKRSKPGDELKGSVIALERKYTKQKEFICSLESGSCRRWTCKFFHTWRPSIICGQNLQSSEDNRKWRLFIMLYHWHWLIMNHMLNVDFYTNHPKFTFFPSGGCHPNTIFSLCSTGRFSTTVIKIGFWPSGQKHILPANQKNGEDIFMCQHYQLF